jgi:hypothetical protein
MSMIYEKQNLLEIKLFNLDFDLILYLMTNNTKKSLNFIEKLQDINIQLIYSSPIDLFFLLFNFSLKIMIDNNTSPLLF